MHEYPNDADGDPLRRVANDGNDMSRPMPIDFAVAVPDRASGESFARAAQAAGYTTSIVFDEEDAAWDCYCSKRMVLSYDDVIDAQRELDQLGSPFGAFCDGWGTFGNKDGG